MTQKTHVRLWPGVIIVLLVAMYGIPLFVPQAFLFGMIGGLVGALAIVVWNRSEDIGCQKTPLTRYSSPSWRTSL